MTINTERTNLLELAGRTPGREGTMLTRAALALPQALPAKAWVVLSATREVDQICGTERAARREVRDLKAMGFDKAKWVAFSSWAEAEAFEDKCKGY